MKGDKVLLDSKNNKDSKPIKRGNNPPVAQPN